MFWGSTSRPHIEDLVMSLFWGPPFMTGDGPKIVHFGPKMAEHGRPVNVPKWSKKGPNGTKMIDPRVFDHMGPFWTISDKI